MTTRQEELSAYGDVEPLMQNLHHPDEVVRIASMRAGMRVAAMELVAKPLRDEIVAQVEQGLSA